MSVAEDAGNLTDRATEHTSSATVLAGEARRRTHVGMRNGAGNRADGATASPMEDDAGKRRSEELIVERRAQVRAWPLRRDGVYVPRRRPAGQRNRWLREGAA